MLAHISIHALREEGDLESVMLEQTDIDFYPRPPRGGRPAASGLYKTTVDISIHALREEGDAGFVDLSGYVEKISIHALREEGDQTAGLFQQSADNFYPRPPRGGRHARKSI